ncbi:MAG: Gfo/Idh/MocA family protein [Desulfobulbus sp.]|jgi:predicted dehydrogenase
MSRGMERDGRPIRIGLIGTGKHGSRYANHLVRDIKGAQLTAICRRDRARGEAQAGDWGCRWFGDWRALVEDPEVDCVIAATPPAHNGEIGAACARAGKPLLMEKPLAVSVREAEALVEHFDRAGVGLTVGQTLRYNPVIRLLREQLPTIAPLCGLTANQRLEPATLAWLDVPELAGAGVTLHTAIHVFDAVRWITGQEIVRVAARIRCVQSRCLEDQLVALFELGNGVLGSLECSKTGHARSGRFELTGEGGQLWGDQVHHVCERVRQMERTVLDPGKRVYALVPLLRDWLAFLRGKGENPVPAGDGLAAVRVCSACLRSAAKDRWEAV